MIAVPEFDRVEEAFPTKAMSVLPAWKDIPDEFKGHGNKWVKVQQDWFFSGMKDCKWVPREGVDTNKALRALAVCQGSFEPSHEHKEAGVAYLMDQWFESVTYKKAK